MIGYIAVFNSLLFCDLERRHEMLVISVAVQTYCTMYLFVFFFRVREIFHTALYGRIIGINVSVLVVKAGIKPRQASLLVE